ncbi:N-acetyltransferase [Alsobacter sp. SYSU M60028]|uniref:N-acetyltransferase n=1 Tax=Alsobacter ponti TaxID=2962936 RepID=A0ABT1LEI5_9HYPH|nr:GNAT family N-acetyltransferase [Alsobacter ponti]MCP8939910.1 N-acetyltransferase [Alsobacter ponti]
MDWTLTHDPDRRRYVLADAAGPVAYAAYVERDGRVVIHHTEVERARRGRGVGAELVRRTLDMLRAQGRVVTPACPFVSDFIDAHPDYADLAR